MESPSTYDLAQQKLGENLERAVEIQRQKAALDAELAVVVDDSRVQVDRLGRSPFNDRILRSEIGAALRMSPRGASLLIEQSYSLVNALPDTLDALSKGTIDRSHAMVIVDQSAVFPPEAKHAFEAAILPYAASTSPSRLKQRAHRLREKLHPESITARRTKAVEDRRIWVNPTEDGMAEIGALLPVEQATAIYNRVTEIARGLSCPEDDRNLTQLRADVFADTLINSDIAAGVGIGAGIVAKVWVTVPVMTLLGHEDAPGTLEGVIPIAPEVASELAAHAPSFTRILTHPETGVVLSMGTTKYKPPKDLQNFIRMRDGFCQSPWFCPVCARFVEIDHTIPFAEGGETSAENLECLCENDHRLKHNSAWQVKQLGRGVLEWTAPSGRVYITRPQLELAA